MVFENENLSNNIIDTASAARQVDLVPGADVEDFAGAEPFAVDLPVTRLYRAYGWRCDKDNQELDPKEHPIVQGEVARVCVTPDDIAINQDNVRIRNIDSFTWTRNEINATQTAISSNAKAEPRTEIFCQPGSTICAFETNLIDDFFSTPGAVQGNGVVWLQFGEDSRRSLEALAVSLELVRGEKAFLDQRRHLQYGLEDFELGASYLPIADPGFAGASPFLVIAYVLPPVQERELYSCRAYECDYSNEEFVSNESKGEGDSIRICVRPSEAAELVGAKMWSIEWWQWSQVDRIQDAVVKQGKEATDGRTVLFCYRGMEVCFFQTTLIPDFFSLPQPNVLNGNGVCWITFGDGFAFPAPIDFEKDPPNSGTETDPTANPLYAGHNDISIVFPTDGNYTFNSEECPIENHTLNQWWEDLDGTTRSVIITAIVLASTGLCCIWGLCLLCNRRDRKKEDLILLEKEKMILNVDVHGANATENFIKTKDNNREEKKEKKQSIDRILYSERPSMSTKSDSKRKFGGSRSKSDVVFNDDDHQGTVKLRRKVRAYIERNPDMDYGPVPYSYLRQKFDDSFFLLRDRETRNCREATKSETVAKIGEIWMKEKSRVKESRGEFTREDIRNMKRRAKETRNEKRKRLGDTRDSKSILDQQET